MKISARRAAEVLGVSRMQISRLAGSGEIKSEWFGNALQIDLDSVHRYQDLRPGPGRPVQAIAAWELLANAQARSLDDFRALSISVRRRSERREYRILPAMIDQLLADSRSVLSGAAAAVQYGASVQDRPPWAIYVRQSDAPSLVKKHRLREADDHNLVVRVVPNDAWTFNNDSLVPLHVAVVDLVDDRDERSAAEALRQLRSRLKGTASKKPSAG